MAYDPLNEINSNGESGLNGVTKFEKLYPKKNNSKKRLKIIEKLKNLPKTTPRQDYYYTEHPNKSKIKTSFTQSKKNNLLSQKQMFYLYKSAIAKRQLKIELCLEQRKKINSNISKLIKEKSQLLINKDRLGKEIWGDDYNKLLKQQKEQYKGSKNKND